MHKLLDDSTMEKKKIIPPPKRRKIESEGGNLGSLANDEQNKLPLPCNPIPMMSVGIKDMQIQQAKNYALTEAKLEGWLGNFRSFNSPFGNFLVPVIPTQADLFRMHSCSTFNKAAKEKTLAPDFPSSLAPPRRCSAPQSPSSALLHVAARDSSLLVSRVEMESNTENNWHEMAKDPKRKAKSNDPGWKYAFWPNLSNKDVVKCVLCGNENHAGINRLKQHLIGGFPDILKCPKTTREIAKEMSEYMQSRKRNKSIQLDLHDDDDEVQEIESTGASNTLPKKKKKTFEFPKMQPKASKSVASMLMRTPEQIIEDRHSKGTSQTTLESRLRTPEEKERVHMHIANFFYECGIPFNVANSRSYEVMVESIGQYGPGLKPPTFHELRVPLLKKAKEETEKQKEKHEKAWKMYGCTLMSDGWTDRRGRHLINFLVNSPEGTFFLGSVNASSESHDASMLANLLGSKIKEIGEKNVVQVVTDNGANYKAAGELRGLPPLSSHCRVCTRTGSRYGFCFVPRIGVGLS